MDRIKDLEKERLKLDLIQLIALQRQKAGDNTQVYDIALNAVMNGGQEVTCYDFVTNFLDLHNIEIRPNGIFQNGDLIRNHKAFFYRLHQQFKDYRKAHNIKDSITRDEIALEFEALLEEQWTAKRNDLRKHLQPHPDIDRFDELITQFVRCIGQHSLGDEDKIEFRRAKAFVAHFIWQVMMKLHRGPKTIQKAGNEAMLLLVSPQQKTGKSTAVRMLVRALDEYGFVWKTRFERLDDQFSFGNLAYNYVAFFDDMHKTTAVNMGKFKQVVTDEEVSFRAMHTQTEMQLPKMVTFIGTANKYARELMPDTTGLRRFHQIAVNNGNVYLGEGIDLDTLDKFPFLELFRCVPLGDNTPMFRYISPQELCVYEEEIRPRTVVEMWLKDEKLEPTPAGQGQLLPTKDLYDRLRIWANNNGYAARYVPTAVSMGHKLSELGASRGRRANVRGFWFK